MKSIWFMGTILLCLFFTVSLFPKVANAQSEIDWLLTQADFKPMLKAHLKEIGRANIPVVSVISISHKDDSLKVYLSSISYLSELEKDLPASFRTVEKRPFLIYDGTETLIDDSQKWFETVKAFVGENLCDDLTFRKLLEQPGPKEIRLPCSNLYHPAVDWFTFWKGHLVKHVRHHYF